MKTSENKKKFILCATLALLPLWSTAFEIELETTSQVDPRIANAISEQISTAALVLKNASGYFELFETSFNELRAFLTQLLAQPQQPFSFDLIKQIATTINNDVSTVFGTSLSDFVAQTKAFGSEMSVLTSGNNAEIMQKLKHIAQFGNSSIPKYIDLAHKVRISLTPLSLASINNFITLNFNLIHTFYFGLNACQYACKGASCKAMPLVRIKGDAQEQCNAIVGELGCLVFDIMPTEEFRCPLLAALKPLVDNRQRLEEISTQVKSSLEGISQELGSPAIQENLAKIKQKIESMGDLPQRLESAAGLLRQFKQ